MNTWSRILMFFLAVSLFACGSSRPSTPLETFKTYTKAIKAKDTETMKLLLSSATMAMHEKEAKAQGVSVDDIVKRETLFSETQTKVEWRDEKIDGDAGSLMVKNSYGSWETVPFIREDGAWKIDKQGFANKLMKDVEDENKKIDELINGGQAEPPSDDFDNKDLQP